MTTQQKKNMAAASPEVLPLHSPSASTTVTALEVLLVTSIGYACATAASALILQVAFGIITIPNASVAALLLASIACGAISTVLAVQFGLIADLA
jgi:hypothetical protein